MGLYPPPRYIEFCAGANGDLGEVPPGIYLFTYLQGAYYSEGLAGGETTPLITKTCSGPGDGMIGEWEWTDPDDHRQGIDIGYFTLSENFVCHVDMGYENQKDTCGPSCCPYGCGYCTDATWHIEWVRAG